MRDYQELLKAVLTRPPYCTWQAVSAGKYRNCQADDNPHLELSAFGLYDHKERKQIYSIVRLARELGVVGAQTTQDVASKPVTFEPVPAPAELSEKDQKEIDAQIAQWTKVFSAAKEDPELVRRYFASRSIDGVSDELISRLHLRVRRYGMKGQAGAEKVVVTEILQPIIDAQKRIINVNRIQVEPDTGKKLSKKFGKGRLDFCDRCFIFGPPTAEASEVVIFEGLENAVCWHRLVSPDCKIVIAYGANGFKHLTSFLSPYRAAGLTIKVILDNDKDDKSLLSSLALGPDVLRYRPAMREDLNDAIKPGGSGLEAWLETLEEVTWEAAQAAAAAREAEKAEGERAHDAPGETEEYTKYVGFIRWFFRDGAIRRDLFSEQLFAKRLPNQEYRPVRQWLPAIKGAARPQREIIETKDGVKSVPKFRNVEAFADYTETLAEFEFEPGLLVDVPEWDGRSRVAELCSHLVAKDFDTEELVSIFIDWGARMWLRLRAPEVNQRFIVLTGAQGAGKDTWIRALVGGLGRHCASIALDDDQTRIERAISELAVGHLPEFDKTRASVELVKDIVTRPHLSFDQKWVVGSVRCPNRCSFIGSANKADILRDWTGNRRFIVIKLQGLRLRRLGERAEGEEEGEGVVDECQHNYPGDMNDPLREENRLQILAEFRTRAEKGDWRLPANVELKVAEIVAELTPQAPSTSVAEAWCAMARRHVAERCAAEFSAVDPLAPGGKRGDGLWVRIRNAGYLSLDDALPLLSRVAQTERITLKTAQNYLNQEHMVLRKQRYWDVEKDGSLVETRESRVYVFKDARFDREIVEGEESDDGFSF